MSRTFTAWAFDFPQGELAPTGELQFQPTAGELLARENVSVAGSAGSAGSAGRTALRWPWSEVQGACWQASEDEDEMDLLILKIVVAGRAAAVEFVFECNSGAHALAQIESARPAPAAAPPQPQVPPPAPKRWREVTTTDWDFVMLVPFASFKPSSCTVDSFVELLHPNAVGGELTTMPCFLSNACFPGAVNGGSGMGEGASRSLNQGASRSLDQLDAAIRAQSAQPARQQKLEAEKHSTKLAFLRKEYEDEMGSSARPCGRRTFGSLVAKAVARRLQQACGLTTMMKFSVDEDEIVLCLRADEGDLAVAADRWNYRLQCNNRPCHHTETVPGATPERVARVREMLSAQNDHTTLVGRESTAKPVLDPLLAQQPRLPEMIRACGHDEAHHDNASLPYISPYAVFEASAGNEHISLLFRHFWDTSGAMLSPFAKVDRLRLVWKIMNRHLNVPGLKACGLVADCFALHDRKEWQWLMDNWATRLFNPLKGDAQPILHVRRYFGEEMAFYFAWLHHYTNLLAPPAVLGCCVLVAPQSGPGMLAYCLVMSVWVSCFLNTWKRRNAKLNLQWGSSTAEGTQDVRPDFTGVLRPNPVTDEIEVHYSFEKRRRSKLLTSLSVFMLCAIGVLLSSGLCYQLRHLLSKPEFGMKQSGILVAATLNALQICLANWGFDMLALRLTNLGNHRTEADWTRAHTMMAYVFRFINSYFVLFYIAFIKTWVEADELSSCDNAAAAIPVLLARSAGSYDGRHCLARFPQKKCFLGCGTKFRPMTCMDELGTQIVLIFAVQFFLFSVAELGVPLLQNKWLVAMERRNLRRKGASAQQLGPPEVDAKLSPYENFDDYSEMLVQYGYVVMFSVAYPVTPLLAFLHNIAELHLDAFKILKYHRRPFPTPSSGIGRWQTFLVGTGMVGMAVSMATVIFTMEMFCGYSTATKWALFVGCEHAALLLKVLIDTFTEDSECWVEEAQARFEWTVAKVFQGARLDDKTDLKEKAEVLDLTLLPKEAALEVKVCVDDRGAQNSDIGHRAVAPKGTLTRDRLLV